MPRRCSADCEGRLSRKDRPGTWTRLLYGSPAVGCTCSVPSIAAGKRWTSTYPKLATVKLRSASSDERWLIPTTAHHTCSPETDCEVILRPFENYRTKVNSVAVVGIEPDATRIIASNPVVLRKLKEEDGPSVRLKIGSFFRQRFRTGCQRTAPGRPDLLLLPT